MSNNAMLMPVEPEHNGSRLLKMIQKRHPDYHPALALADMAHSTQDQDLEFKCHAELLGFIEPKLKSIEVKVEDPRDRRVIRVSLFEPIEAEIVKEVSDVPSVGPLPSHFPAEALLGGPSEATTEGVTYEN